MPGISGHGILWLTSFLTFFQVIDEFLCKLIGKLMWYCMGKFLCEFIVKFMGGCAQRYIQGSSFCFVIVSHQAFVLSLYMSDTNRMAWVESQSSAFELGLERTHPQMHSRMYPRMYRTTHQHTHPRNMHPITHP